MRQSDRQSRTFFEERYLGSCDPWNFATSAYELERYQITLNALSRDTYRYGFEPGCSIGVLTSQLAHRTLKLFACDISETAVTRAQERCRALDHVEIRRRDIAAGPPDGSFDLMVFSELGYYFHVDELRTIVLRMARRLASGGEFVAVHWLGDSPDHLLHGDEVHEVLARTLPAEWFGGSRHAGFRVDSWRRPP